MGCLNSKLDNEEAVQICKDRKRFIKEALDQRSKFATGHIAYIQALKRVSIALRKFVEEDDAHHHRDILLNFCAKPPFTPLKISPATVKSIPPTPIKFETSNSSVVNYLRSGGNPVISIEERPQSPETVRIETFAQSPVGNHNGMIDDGFFNFRSPVNHSSSFFSSPFDHKPSFPPLSPRTSQWDFFWNPFSSLDSYGYPARDSLDRAVVEDDEVAKLKQVRKEEGIPDLEDEGEREEIVSCSRVVEEMKIAENGEEEKNSAAKDGGSAKLSEVKDEIEISFGGGEIKGFRSRATESVQVSEAQNVVDVEVGNEEAGTGDGDKGIDGETTPGFTVYMSPRPMSIVEVIKNIENQFVIACDSANEVSTMLEVSSTPYASTPNEITVIKMLNPVALFRSASSRSSSSRTFQASSSWRDDGCDSSSDFSEESCMLSGSHHSTLDRLYAWEKKLYKEVKSGERIRVAYEKKCMQLRNQDAKGEDFFIVERTRIAIRDLHTQINVSIHSVESAAKRIETLRDEELQPQLMELIQGLARMWRVMAECHQAQRQILLEAAGISTGLAGISPENYLRSTFKLENEIQNWQICFSDWISSQRSYVQSLNAWLLRCLHLDSFSNSKPKIPFSPQRIGAPPIFSFCVHWCNLSGKIQEIPVIDSLKSFSAGVRSLHEQQVEDMKQKKRADHLDGKLGLIYRSESKRLGFPSGSGEISLDSGGVTAGREMSIESFRKEVELERERQKEMADRTAADSVRVLLEGLGGAVSCLTEFAVNSAEGYEDLVKLCERVSQLYGGESVRPSLECN